MKLLSERKISAGAGLLRRFATPIARAWAVLLLALAMLAFHAPAHAQTRITDIRIGAHADFTRFVVEFDRAVAYSAFTLANPDRVVIDLPEVKWDRKQAPPKGVISGFRYGLFRSGVSRIVLDTTRAIRIQKHFRLGPKGKDGHRLVLDLVPMPAGQVAAQKVASADWQAYASRQRQTSVSPAPGQSVPSNSGKKIVVLDPGHGGPDPGAIGSSGVYEKKITLAVAKRAKQIIEKTGKYRVILTRNKDIYIPLRRRYAVAENANAELFISLHADKIGRKDVRGASVYTLSEKASDKEAAALARKENKSDIIAGENLSEYDENVAHILLDIQQRSTMQDSAHFAEMLVADLGRSVKLLRNTHRFAGFAVLKSPTVPSVLIELGYLSNRKDEKLLRTPAHHTRISEALLRAVEAYFKRQDRLSRS